MLRTEGEACELQIRMLRMWLRHRMAMLGSRSLP
jgi:hypothetical protein